MVTASTDTLDASTAGTLVVNNVTINTGTGGTVNITADDELWIGPGSAKTLTMTGGTLNLNANADGLAASGADRFFMFTNSAIAGTAEAVNINLNNSQSTSFLWSIAAAAGSPITVTHTGTGGVDQAGGTIGTTGNGNVTFNAQGSVSINGTINAGSGLIDLNANNDGSGAQSLTIGETAVLTTTNATPGAIDLRVNTALGGTGGLNLGGSLTTGTGGVVTASTDTLDAVTAGTLVVNNATINTGTGGTVNLFADDELWIGTGVPAKTLTMTGGTLNLNANTDGLSASSADRFFMFTNSAIAGTAEAVNVNVNNSQSTSQLWSIAAAAGSPITVTHTGTGGVDQAGGTIGTTGNGDVTFNAQGSVVDQRNDQRRKRPDRPQRQ